MKFLAVFLLLGWVAAQQQLTVYHRFVDTDEAWSKKGTLTVDPRSEEGEFTPAHGYEPKTSGRYQLAITEGGEAPSHESSVIIVDSCLLVPPANQRLVETLQLFYEALPGTRFLHFNYMTNGVTSCAAGAESQSSLPDVFTTGAVVNVKVSHAIGMEGIKYKYVPPVIASDGTVVEPPPEKTFLQKYWVYLLGAAFILLGAGGGDQGSR